jgi:hypothetical protein
MFGRTIEGHGRLDDFYVKLSDRGISVLSDSQVKSLPGIPAWLKADTSQARADRQSLAISIATNCSVSYMVNNWSSNCTREAFVHGAVRSQIIRNLLDDEDIYLDEVWIDENCPPSRFINTANGVRFEKDDHIRVGKGSGGLTESWITDPIGEGSGSKTYGRPSSSDGWFAVPDGRPSEGGWTETRKKDIKFDTDGGVVPEFD